MSDREEMQAARSAGLVKRHETRESRAVRIAYTDALRDDLDYGNCPGTLLKVGNQEVWLHTREDIRSWLVAALKASLHGEED